jgi:hypothetical protein
LLAGDRQYRRTMTPNEFADLVAPITGWIDGRSLDDALEAGLNRAFPPDGCAIVKRAA